MEKRDAITFIVLFALSSLCVFLDVVFKFGWLGIVGRGGKADKEVSVVSFIESFYHYKVLVVD